MVTMVYDWVRQSRAVLLDFCEQLTDDHFTRELAGFGWATVQQTIVHVSDCYCGWLGECLLTTPRQAASSGGVDLSDVRRRFESADALVNQVVDNFRDRMDQPVHRSIPRRPGESLTVSPLQLLMHTITHEFHHKGQILSMARQMGYVPPDTDLLRT